eukprot:TRINITY_DN10596_c0_g3_i3.p1 TRINITY_DN10596_c0_g3~~TRINITY_DN10596_c0_g3_i3.p1  ORF type:complete len:1096 (-),score=248.22 TRINITY_DN10596_c0_g3_i3:301-3312(-)
MPATGERELAPGVQILRSSRGGSAQASEASEDDDDVVGEDDVDKVREEKDAEQTEQQPNQSEHVAPPIEKRHGQDDEGSEHDEDDEDDAQQERHVQQTEQEENDAEQTEQQPNQSEHAAPTIEKEHGEDDEGSENDEDDEDDAQQDRHVEQTEQLPDQSEREAPQRAKGGIDHIEAEQEKNEKSIERVREEQLREEAGDQASAGMQLVAQERDVADVQACEAHQIVAAESGAAEVWGGTLPPEASGAWTVDGDSCSLQIAGAELKLPKTVHERLYGYQREGVVWMWNLFQKGFGGILADEMGLGKTVQTAAFLASLKFTEQAHRFLVVVPVTLLVQWRRELNAWAHNTGLAAHVMQGSAHERKTALRGFASKGGVLLTSHDLIRHCIQLVRTAGLATAAGAKSKKRKRQDKRGVKDDDSPSEAEEEMPVLEPHDHDENKLWDVVVVDEGHQIKNPSCQSGRALRRIDARSRFLLTGTPLQNKLSDLWALMDFAQPALLGNHATFERSFSEQIAKGSKRNASRFEVELKDHLARELKRLTAPHFLRRLKCEVIGPSGAPRASSLAVPSSEVPKELPRKMDVVLWLNLTPAQTELYNLSLSSDLVRSASGTGKCGMETLRAIALLKKLCGHPLLCLPQEEYNQWRMQTLASGSQASQASSSRPEAPPVGAQPEDLEDAATQPALECQELLPRLRALLPNSAQGAALLSCKLRILSVLLPQLQRRGHRCLIFSQSVRMLDLIQASVLRVLGLKFLRIDGSIDPKDRDLKLMKFQQPDSTYFALCLSMQVGGTGLTVTGADRVILVDPAWNPSADAQAIDRVHRIGQTREVVVYRLIASSAIEDKMFRLQIFKRGLSKTFMEHEQQVRFFTHKQLKQLFEPPNQSTSTQSLMAEQIGTEALEHEDLLKVVAGDVGSTDDPDSMAFWQSQDVLGFSDYQRLFMFLEQTDKEEEQAVEQAKELTAKLKNEEYVKDQCFQRRVRAGRELAKENLPPQGSAETDAMPIEDA